MAATGGLSDYDSGSVAKVSAAAGKDLGSPTAAAHGGVGRAGDDHDRGSGERRRQFRL